MMKKFLHIDGRLPIPTQDTVAINMLYELTLRFKVPVALVKTDEGVSMMVEDDTLAPGEERNFCDFLAEVGKKLPGQIVGELEVWWPMAVEAGPQWWTLNEAGQLFITESEIVRGEPQKYGG